ncbi:MAG: hypothetical protein QGD91_13215, partial [Actinomycetota bacterium]|nr:hypothetical protein [Actinomycetota bacterium]
FGGRLLRGEKLNTRYQSVTQDDHHRIADEPNTDEEVETYTSDRTDLHTLRIDGHSVGFWATLAAAITTTTLLVGTWWT